MQNKVSKIIMLKECQKLRLYKSGKKLTNVTNAFVKSTLKCKKGNGVKS